MSMNSATAQRFTQKHKHSLRISILVYFALLLIHIWKLLALFWLHQLDPSLILLLICPIPAMLLANAVMIPSTLRTTTVQTMRMNCWSARTNKGALLSGWGLAMGLNFEMCDPTAVVNNTETLLRHRTTSSGGPLWSMAPSVYI